MKNTCLFLLFLLPLSSAFAQTKSRIFFFRDPKLVSAIGGYDIYLDSTLVGRIEHGGIKSYSCAPGEHTISAKTKGEGVAKVNLKPGATYYMECGVMIDPEGGRPALKLVSAEEGKKAMRTIDPSSVSKIDTVKHDTDEFGIKTGVNFSSFSASINSTPSSVAGFHIGIYYKTLIGRDFYLRPEIYYSSQGQKDDFGPAEATTTTVNYINIPLLFETGRIVTFQFGPQLGLLLSGKEVGKINGTPVNDDLKPYMKSPDFSLLLGAGINPSRNFHLGVRYQLGMSNIFQTSSTMPEVKNRVIHVYAAVSF